MADISGGVNPSTWSALKDRIATCQDPTPVFFFPFLIFRAFVDTGVSEFPKDNQRRFLCCSDAGSQFLPLFVGCPPIGVVSAFFCRCPQAQNIDAPVRLLGLGVNRNEGLTGGLMPRHRPVPGSSLHRFNNLVGNTLINVLLSGFHWLFLLIF